MAPQGKSESSASEPSLRARKQQLARAAIYEAAIDLFASKGFDETTVIEIANAAAVGRRSFFRYFESKGDLLAHSAVSYGDVLAKAIAACPPGLPPFEVMKAAVHAGVLYTSRPESRTREVVAIALASRLARQAHQSRMMEIEDSVSAAFVSYFKREAATRIQPRMLAGITLSIMSATIVSWFKGDYTDLSTAAKQMFESLSHSLGHDGAARKGRGSGKLEISKIQRPIRAR